MKSRSSLFTILSLTTLFSLAAPASLPAEPLFSETWSQLKAGDEIMDSDRWTMGLGSSSQLQITENPNSADGGLVLSPRPDGGTVPIMLSIGRFPLDQEGLALSVNLALGDKEDGFQFGIRKADAGGGVMTGTYRVIVKASEISLNRFPIKGEGQQKVIGKYSSDSDDFQPGDFFTVTLQATPLSGDKTRLEVFRGDEPVISVISSDPGGKGVPGLDEEVRVFLLPDGSRKGFVKEISLSSGSYIP